MVLIVPPYFLFFYMKAKSSAVLRAVGECVKCLL
jgi:hypothetical protein